MFYPTSVIKEIYIRGVRVRSDGFVSLNGGPFSRGTKILHNKKKVKTKGHTPKWYYKINIWGRQFSVHRLVASAFCKNPAPKEFKWVDHIGHSLDNRSCNLRWVNTQLNCMHSSGRCAFYEPRGVVRRNGKTYYYIRGKPWASKVCGCPKKWFKMEEEAVAHSAVVKAARFREIYRSFIVNEDATTRYCEVIHGRPMSAPPLPANADTSA